MISTRPMNLHSNDHRNRWPRDGSAVVAAILALILLVGAPRHASAADGGAVTVIQDRTERVTTEIKTRTVEATTPPSKARRTAIFVENRSKSVPNDKVLFFEDQVSSQLSGKEFAVISREEVMKAKKVYPTEMGGEILAIRTSAESAQATAIAPGARAGSAVSRSSAEVVFNKPKDQNESANRNSLGSDQDRLMSDNASALRLAQLMGAEFILFANIGSYDKETTTVNRPDLDLKVRNTVHTIRGTYKIIDGYEGG